jgi:hypothetical protein
MQCNLHYFVYYGFILECNPYNSCEFPLRLSSSDANFSEKSQLLRRFHQFDSTHIPVTRDFNRTNSRVLMSFYRLCVADAIELDKIKLRLISSADVEQKDPLSFLGLRNELAALRIIGTIANDQLRANFPTSIEQDYKYLTQELSENVRLCVRAVLGEKEVLLHYSDMGTTLPSLLESVTDPLSFINAALQDNVQIKSNQFLRVYLVDLSSNLSFYNTTKQWELASIVDTSSAPQACGRPPSVKESSARTPLAVIDKNQPALKVNTHHLKRQTACPQMSPNFRPDFAAGENFTIKHETPVRICVQQRHGARPVREFDNSGVSPRLFARALVGLKTSR